jgi:soluble lytic murein transglycosylase-like protein
MKRKYIALLIMVAAAWSLLATPARAQINSYVDEHGKLVFINEDSPAPRTGSTISSPSWGSPAGPKTLQPVPSDRLENIVREAAERHQVDPALVKAVISTESGWNPHAVSRKGAMGLMQLIPGTAQRYGVGNPYDPAQNIEGGTTYLKALLDRYNGDVDKTLAAYNAGEHAVDRSGGVPAIPETLRYVRKVNAYFRPGSGHNSTLWSPPKTPVRREVADNGRVIFTNE